MPLIVLMAFRSAIPSRGRSFGLGYWRFSTDMEHEEQSQEPFISGIRLPGESLPKIHPDYATDGLTEPLKPIVREGGKEQPVEQE